MQLEQNGSFSLISERFAQLKGQSQTAKGWAESAAEAFRESLAYYYEHPNPGRSSATNYLRQRLRQADSDRLIDHLQVSLQVTREGIVVTVGMEAGDPEIIALVQEYGATIEVTDRMRGFLSANGLNLKGETKAIRVPARHPWRKAWEATERQAIQTLLNHF